MSRNIMRNVIVVFDRIAKLWLLSAVYEQNEPIINHPNVIMNNMSQPSINLK